MTERERFEEWFDSLNWFTEGIPLGVYRITAWDAWRACAEEKDKRIKKLEAALQFYVNTYTWEFSDEARKALEES
jgi:hypothetical protein